MAVVGVWRQSRGAPVLRDAPHIHPIAGVSNGVTTLGFEGSF